ncbi:MAG: type IV conjugative transfer system protein TraL [Betaproteobacteria bacterium]|nr:type IV conjugative transfer system protein TraL [Betaproteobacteria bacterium]
MSDHTTRIARRLNDAWRIAWFDAVVVMPFLMFFMLGLITDQKLFCITVGLGISFGIQRLKAAQHPAFFSHLSRWIVPSGLTTRRSSFPPPDVQGRIG